MRWILFVLTALMIPALLSAKDDIWTNRGSEPGAKLIVNYYKDLYTKAGDYDSCWKYVEALEFYSKNYVKKEEKKQWLEIAVKAGEKAVKLKPKGLEGLLWYGAVYGKLTELNMDPAGVTKVIEIADKIIAIDPSFGGGTAYLMKARLYHKAPGWPISIGDHDKALANYQLAYKYGKEIPVLYLYYAEFLVEKGKKPEALALIEKGLKIKYDPLNPDHKKMKEKLAALKEKCK
ncbi:MAG: hypothetical protein A2Y33_05820 [Spirochaetes bacterium GWF1_51_8]|nr:MAG: hypothetical protein A2Y33_05820 [Spirochaetes bacterium GWF1_51_8]